MSHYQAFALWFDMRTIPDPNLPGTGRKVGENGSDCVVIAINKTSEAAGALNLYIFLIMDAQLNIQDGRLADILY